MTSPRFLTVVSRPAMFLIALVCAVLAAGCVRADSQPDRPAATATPPAPAPAAPPRESAPPAKPIEVQIEMKNVRLHVNDGIVLDIGRLRGTMVGRTAGKPPLFDDQGSYVLLVSAASMAMDMASLTSLMNAHVFAYEGAPLTGLSVHASEDGRLAMRGKLHKGLTVPFSTVASVSTTAEGGMRVHVESMKALGVPAKGLMDLLGLKLETLVDLKNRRGVDVQDNDIIIAPGQVLPPPEIRGRLARVAVRNGQLLLAYAPNGTAPPPMPLPPPLPPARNYIYFSGGSIRFGKLTMTDTDLQLVDTDDRDPFDFYPAKYNGQLVAGYSKNTVRHGLRTYMPDYNDLTKHR